VTNPDFKDLFACFAAAEVRYLVVGGYAVAFHGHPRHTKDVDVWIDRSRENATRAQQALAVFGAPLGDVTVEDLMNPELVLQLGVAPNRIDILTQIEGVDFERAWAARATMRYAGQQVPVLGLEDLIRSKRASGRPRDLEDVRALLGEGEGD
jgi:hypothetical protein